MFNCALIGCGYWGSKLKRYIIASEDFYLKHVCNSESDLNIVWNDRKVDAVIVATPNHTHYGIVKSALIHGKHVLSEKPLALRTVECEELKKIAEENGVQLLTEYTYTFSKSINLMEKWVGEGKIGRLHGLDMSVRHLGRFGGGSVYWLLGSHMLSVLDIFVPLNTLKFSKKDLVLYNVEVETGVIFFENEEVAGQILVSLNYPGKETRVILYGEEGSIIYDPLAEYQLNLTMYERLRWTVADKLHKEIEMLQIDESNNIKYSLENFCDCIEGRSESNIERAISITRIIEEL